ncbi:Bestrophin-like protein [Aphelenchoides bicaudatus]|nr:Bestrophin-like protein [Aphelenchoides bicaudatus]
MTITYTLEVSQVRFINLIKLLARWRGSVYKLMYKELLSFLLAYYTIAFTYRYVLNDIGKRRFETFCIYCKEFSSVVPVTFILGFYLSFVAGRWWSQYLSIPWPDKLAIEISAYVRYLNLISCLTFQYTSTIVKSRFPTTEHLVSAGIMTNEEKTALENTPSAHGVWWIPAQWFAQLVMIARKEGRIHDDLHVKTLIDSLGDYRGMAGTVWSYDWISVPLSYTQVVAIAVYSFFVSCLFGRQYLYLDISVNSNNLTNYDMDFYFPIFTCFQFLFYVGWLKVAEAMICPFGEDDDDFNLNWIIDRNIQVGYLIVDQMYRSGPKPSKDSHWNDVVTEIPYTQAAQAYRTDPFFGSTTEFEVPAKQSEWIVEQPMPPIDEEAAIGFTNSSSLRRRLMKQKTNDQIDSLDSTKDGHENANESDVSMHSHSDSDEHSNSSIQYEEEKNRRGRLTSLLMGVSRQTLGSSKQSLSSRLSSRKRSSTSKFSFQRSPPSSLMRPKSIPNSRQKLNKTRKMRGSSPIVHRDGIPDDIMSDSKLYALKMQQSNQHSEEKSGESTQRNFSNIETKNSTDDAVKSPSERPASLEFRSRADTGHSTDEHKNLDSTSRTPLIPIDEEAKNTHK